MQMILITPGHCFPPTADGSLSTRVPADNPSARALWQPCQLRSRVPSAAERARVRMSQKNEMGKTDVVGSDSVLR